MTPKCITLKRGQRPKGAGAFGKYYLISKGVGVKVLGSLWEYSVYRSVEALKESNAWVDAQKEAELLRTARKSQIVPKCYGVTIVRRQAGQGWIFSAGIVMQHIPGKVVGDRLPYEQLEKLMKQLAQKIRRKCGLHLLDMHGWNIMVTGKQRKRYWVIDFSPECVRRR